MCDITNWIWGLGAGNGTIWKEKRSNKEPRVQAIVMGNTRELVLEASGVKPPHILPQDEHRKQSQATATHQRDQNALRLKALRSQVKSRMAGKGLPKDSWHGSPRTFWNWELPRCLFPGKCTYPQFCIPVQKAYRTHKAEHRLLT